jgi:5-methylcytosine-specific restriction endonuclease McrA
LGDGRSEKSFCASLKNAKDVFDAHVDSGRIGWVDHAAGDEPYRQEGLVRSVLEEWGSRSDDDLRNAVTDILTGAATAPTSDQALLISRTRTARGKLKPRGGRPDGNRKPTKVETIIQSFVRDPYVRAFVLEEANGTCEACASRAPFLDGNGDPFLEVHHVDLLAEGGADVVENAAALCPNCHRRLHYGADRLAYRAMLVGRISRLTR